MKSVKKSLMLAAGLSFGFFSTGSLADCAPADLSWGLVSSDGKTKYCQTSTFTIKEGQTATYFNSGQLIDGKRYVGSVEAKCSAGRVVQVSSSCKEGSGASGSTQLESTRITGENFSHVAVSNGSTSTEISNRSESRKRQAESVNKLEDTGLPFDLGDTQAIARAEEAIDGAKSMGAIVGSGSSGSILSGFTPIDVKAVILEISAQFHATDGSQFKYVDTVFCAPVCQDPIRSSMSVVKGGSRGHYWGYEQVVKTTKQINIVAPANTPFTVTLGQNHLLKEANVRINFVPADGPVPGNPGDFFPKTTKGFPVCTGFVNVTYDSSARTATSEIVPLVRDDARCLSTPVRNTSSYFCTRPPRGGNISCFGDSTGNSALSVNQYSCPSGTTKYDLNPVVVCRSN